MPVFILAKVAMIACWLFPLLKMAGIDAVLYDSPVTRAIALIMFIAGLLVVVLSLVHLGRSARVGIPIGETELKTHGVYRLSRNPLYTGAFLMCLASCLYSPHPLNFLLAAIAVGVHHRIVTKEEEFLERAFGEKWLSYKRRVPRYIGLIRTDK